MSRAKEMGYTVRLYYIYLNSVELSLHRIAERVRHGGHGVESEIAIRRYARSLQHFFESYLPLADDWWLIDNSSSAFREIAVSFNGTRIIYDEFLYKELKNRYGTSNG